MKLIQKQKVIDSTCREPKFLECNSGIITEVNSCNSGWNVHFGNCSGVILPYDQMYDSIPKVGQFIELATIRATQVVGCKLDKQLIYLMTQHEMIEHDILQSVYYKITYEKL